MKYHKWKILASSTENELLTTDKLIELLLENRGLKTKKEKDDFLNPKIKAVDLTSVKIDSKEVEKALKRITEAVNKNQKIVIYGDYDVDGICGTAILWETIYSYYKNVIPYIPSRMDEGYGLSKKGIDNLMEANHDIGLIITVDNGIVANEAVEYANNKGIDVVITDHHVRSDKDPKAICIVHTTSLCGTGVAYMLSLELAKNVGITPRDNHLELVALATVADLVPLVGGNRILLKYGLEKLRKTTRPGLLALFSEAQIKRDDIDTYHIGHIIAPRLNASGRITHALNSLRLICTNDTKRAKELALSLAQTNRDRQNYTQESTIHADSIVEINERIIFVHHEEYEQGVIGLIASRLVEKHYRPAIAVSVGPELSKGSARSVSGFNIIEFLRLFDSHLVNAGGHPMAAGFTVETTKLETFKKALLEKGRELVLDEHLERVLQIDVELDLNLITHALYKKLTKLAPFGMANNEPTFVSKQVIVEDLKLVGREKNHLKLKISQNGKTMDAIMFGAGDQNLKIGDLINVVYTINNQEWNGLDRLDLKLKDLKVSSL